MRTVDFVVDEGKTGSLIRARTLIYPILLLGIATAFVSVFLATKSFDAVLLREPGNPHTITDDDQVRNILKLKLTNRTDEPMTFAAEVESPSGSSFEVRESELVVEARASQTFHVSVVAPRDSIEMGRADLQINIRNQDGIERTLRSKMIGPYN